MDNVIHEQLQRLRALWPALNAKHEVTDEITRAIKRHESKLAPEDVVAGFDEVIATSPTNGWPPGPHEIVGCVLHASRARRSDAPRPQYPPRTELVNRQCSKCGGPVALLPTERVVYCGACNLVQSLGTVAGRDRYHLDWNEINTLPVRDGMPPADVTGHDALRWLRDSIAKRRAELRDQPRAVPSFMPNEDGDEIGWDDAA